MLWQFSHWFGASQKRISLVPFVGSKRLVVYGLFLPLCISFKSIFCTPVWFHILLGTARMLHINTHVTKLPQTLWFPRPWCINILPTELPSWVHIFLHRPFQMFRNESMRSQTLSKSLARSWKWLLVSPMHRTPEFRRSAPPAPLAKYLGFSWVIPHWGLF